VLPQHAPVDWAIYGVPFDGGVTYRPGCRFGPRAIRDASQYLKRFHIEHGVDVCEILSMADAGDAPVSPYDCKENIKVVSAWASVLADAMQTKLLALGGDHSIAYANIKATWERRGRPKNGLALIHFDSHLDTVDQVWGELWGHASPFLRAIEDGLVDPSMMISLGIKGPLVAGSDLDVGKRLGIRVHTYEMLRPDPCTPLRAFVQQLAGREAYLTFDVDVVDPAYAPGTGTPCPGGFTSAEVFRMLRSLAGVRLAGADVVEVLPQYDHAEITSLLAAHVAFEILALDALARRE
jgi:agmatinase